MRIYDGRHFARICTGGGSVHVRIRIREHSLWLVERPVHTHTSMCEFSEPVEIVISGQICCAQAKW